VVDVATPRLAAALAQRVLLNRGLKRSEEVKERIRAANLGKKRSPEARAKMRASRLRYLATQKRKEVEIGQSE